MAGAFQSSGFQNSAFQTDAGATTASDSVTTSDAVTRTQVLFRTAADAITTSSTVVATAGQRSASDTVTISTAPTRVLAAGRTDSDTLTISSAVSRSVGLSRTAADTVTTSTTVAGTRNFLRTAADTLTISTAPVGIKALARTASDHVTVSTVVATSFVTRTVIDYVHATDVAMMSGPIGVSATDSVGIDDFVAQATPRAETTVQILINGIDVSADVVYETAYFKGLVNSKPGEAKMRVRDLYSTYDFLGTEGADWLLLVNGDPVWRGFLTIVKEVFIYSAGNVAESGLQRFWDLEGSDLNILFSRRVVFKESNPATVTGTKFPPGTPDTTAITELLRHWLDLSDDHLDTTSGVENVGDLDPAQPTQAWSGGWYWGDAMNAIAMLPAAIFYIRPEVGNPRGTLVYCDTDVPTAPFGLSDQPNGTTTKGFREMEISLDGTSLANDVLAWGMGYGSQTPVFKREQASGSITTHGLWQQASINTGIYKQASINRVADSIVNGSPENHRGAKSDRPAVRLVTYEPGLLNGHVVTFTSEVWGWTDDIPVRQMEVTFESPVAPRFELLLSHEIDSPWGFIDQFWPQLPGIPPFPYPTPPVPPGFPVPDPAECDCGITDAFGRTIAANQTTIGTSDAGIPWTVIDGGVGATVEVTPDTGLILLVPAAEQFGTQVLLPNLTIPSDEFDVTFRVMFTDFVPTESSRFDINYVAFLRLNPGLTTSSITVSFGLSTAHADKTWEQDVWYNVRIRSEDAKTTLDLGIWKDDEPENTTPVLTGLSMGTPVDDFSVEVQNRNSPGEFRVQFDQLSISNYDRCLTAQFDDFNRTVALGWGTATPGNTLWTRSIGSGSSVNGTDGLLTHSGAAGTQSQQMIAEGGPWLNEVFDARILFKTPATIPTTPYSRFEVQFRDASSFSGGDAIFHISSTVGTAEASPNSVTKNDWAADTWYWLLLHADYVAETFDVTVWELGDAEPSSPTVSGTTDPLYVRDASTEIDVIWAKDTAAGTSRTLTIASIDFDYTDKPCSVDCEDVTNGVVIDDFERSVGAGGWGTASSGNNWSRSAVSGTTVESVTGGNGSSVVAAAGITDMTLTLSSAVTTQFAGKSWIEGRWLLSQTYGGHIGGLYNNAFSQGMIWQIENTVFPGTGGMSYGRPSVTQIMLNSSGGAFIPPTDGTPFWVAVRADFVAGRIYGKAWLASDAEPALNPTSVSIGTLTAATVTKALYRDAMSSPGTMLIGIIEADFLDDVVCTDVEPTVPPVSTSPSGFGCETPQRQSSTVYTTASPFVPHATSVWVNGLLMNRGSDYTEGSDNHSITFSSPVSASSTVGICYYVGGPSTS